MTTEHEDDPRLDSQYVRTFDGTRGSGAVTLVGVVHDHPASIYRVEHVVSETNPSVLALELPPLAVSLYRSYATESESSSTDVGEMSAAIQAARTDDVVGIDGPSLGFVRVLGRCLWQEGASPMTVLRSVRSLLSMSKTAFNCKLAASTPLTGAVESARDHETTTTAPPDEQAADERRQLRAATAVMEAFETSPSSRHRKKARERHMADRLESLRDRNDVVAIVGAGHFGPLCEYLDGQ